MELYKSNDMKIWKEALKSYPTSIMSLNKPNLVTLDEFYCSQLPTLLHSRLPAPYLTRSELHSLMQWKLTRGKFRPRLLDFVASLDEELVKSASQKAFLSLPDDISKAVSELTVLKGVGPATASAVLAVYAPEVAPFMSDEAMEAVLGHSKDYSLKQYLLLAKKLLEKAKELSSEDEQFTASDVERALWSSAIEAKLSASSAKETQITSKKTSGRKRKNSS
ncbi:Leucine--tRNA ligase [Bienertia sinuspersici]